MEQLGAPLLLVCSSVAPDAVDDDALGWPSSCTRWPSGPRQRGLRIAYEALAWGRHVSEYDHAWRIVRARRPPGARHRAWTASTCSRAARRWTRSRRSRRTSSSTSSSPTRRGWPWTSCSGAATTAASPARAASTSPASPAACSTPATPARCRSRCSTTSSARPTRSGWRRDALRSLRLLEDELGTRDAARRRPSLGGYAFVELAVEPASAGATQRVLHALGFAPRRPAPDQAGDAVAPGRRARAAERRRRGRAGRRRAGRRERGPGASAARGGVAARPPAAAPARPGRGRPERGRGARRHAVFFSRTAGAGSATSSRWRARGGRRRARPASTTSRSTTRSTRSTRPSSSTARCSAWSRATAPSTPGPTGSCAAAR